MILPNLLFSEIERNKCWTSEIAESPIFHSDNARTKISIDLSVFPNHYLEFSCDQSMSSEDRYIVYTDTGFGISYVLSFSTLKLKSIPFRTLLTNSEK